MTDDSSVKQVRRAPSRPADIQVATAGIQVTDPACDIRAWQTHGVDLEEAVRRLHVVRKFSSEPVSDDDLLAILDAGRHAGSSKNLQRWHFIVVRDHETLVRLSAVGQFAGHLAGGVLAIALVTPDPDAADSPLSVMWDLGRAAQNMVLVAWARGLGSVPATVYDHELCRSILAYPQDRHCEYILNIGHPGADGTLTRPLRAGGRLTLPEVVFSERWGQPLSTS